MVLSKRADLLYVISCLRSGSAEAAGMRPGDYIVDIDGVSTEDKSIMEVEAMLKGPSGSNVRVSVFRSARTEPLVLEIKRGKTESAIGSRILEGNVGLLEIPALSGDAVQCFPYPARSIETRHYDGQLGQGKFTSGCRVGSRGPKENGKSFFSVVPPE